MILTIVLLPPLLFALANIMDRLLVEGEEDDSHPLALTGISALFNGVLAILIITYWVSKGMCIQDKFGFVCLVANGMTYVTAIYLYLVCLRNEDLSSVVPYFQLIPVFGIVGGAIFLKEFLTVWQILAVLSVVLSGYFLSTVSSNAKIAIYMSLASLLFAVNDVVFANFARKMDASVAISGDVLGKALISSIAFIFPVARRGLVIGFKKRLGLQSLSEIFAILGDFFIDLAKIFAPVAIVQAICTTQPVFVLILAGIFAIWFKVLRPELNPRKIVCIMLLVSAGAYLAYSTA